MRCSTEEVFGHGIGLCDTNGTPMMIKIEEITFFPPTLSPILTFYNWRVELNSGVLLFKPELNGMI